MWPCWTTFCRTLILAAWMSVFQMKLTFRWRCRNLSSSCIMPAWILSCSHLDDTGLISEPVSQPQLNVIFIRLALVMVSLHSSKTLRYPLINQDGLSPLLPFVYLAARFVHWITDGDPESCWPAFAACLSLIVPRLMSDVPFLSCLGRLLLSTRAGTLVSRGFHHTYRWRGLFYNTFIFSLSRDKQSKIKMTYLLRFVDSCLLCVLSWSLSSYICPNLLLKFFLRQRNREREMIVSGLTKHVCRLLKDFVCYGEVLAPHTSFKK